MTRRKSMTPTKDRTARPNDRYGNRKARRPPPSPASGRRRSAARRILNGRPRSACSRSAAKSPTPSSPPGCTGPNWRATTRKPAWRPNSPARPTSTPWAAPPLIRIALRAAGEAPARDARRTFHQYIGGSSGAQTRRPPRLSARGTPWPMWSSRTNGFPGRWGWNICGQVCRHCQIFGTPMEGKIDAE